MTPHTQIWESLTDEQQHCARQFASALVLTGHMAIIAQGLDNLHVMMRDDTWPPKLKAAWERVLAAHSDFEKTYDAVSTELGLTP